MGGKTTDEYAINVIKAQRIHLATGQPVWPWEVDDMPSDWMDAIDAVFRDAPAKAAKIPKPRRK